MLISLKCLWILLLVCSRIDRLRATNVTFTPESIRVTLASLPAPFSTTSVSKSANVIAVPADPRMEVPAGFSVRMFTLDLTSPRYMIYTPSGDILVSESNINRTSCLVDSDGDGFPDQRLTFADGSNGLNYPFGMAFLNNWFYVADRAAVRRFAWTTGSRNVTGTGEILMTYPSTGHATRTLVFSPNGDRMYVSVGSESNVNMEPLPRASLQQASINGTNQTTFASGLRNIVGLAFHPVTNELYASCQERDELGDDLVPDYMTRIQQSEFYGWPYAYLSPNLTDPRRTVNNVTENATLVAQTKVPDVLFQAHSAVMDMRFYTGTQFPTKYRSGAFAAFRGSWNRNTGTGYKIVFIPFDSTTNRPTGAYEDFVRGFLTDPSGPTTFARPVGVLVMKDGSLLFSEDGNSRLYRVQYSTSNASTPIPYAGNGFTRMITGFSFVLVLLSCMSLSFPNY